jgi:hypothetical protein
MGKGRSKAVASERKPDDVSHIKNKQKRSAVLARVRDAKARAKKEARALEIEKANAEGRKIEKQVPPTVESQREPDETHVDEGDSEVEADMNDDEFAECAHHCSPAVNLFDTKGRYFKGQAPRTVITTCRRPTKIM